MPKEGIRTTNGGAWGITSGSGGSRNILYRSSNVTKTIVTNFFRKNFFFLLDNYKLGSIFMGETNKNYTKNVSNGVKT